MAIEMGGDAAAALANGRYRLVSILGEGGQATVYRAWDRRLGTWRAIKVLSPGSPRSLRERFEAEARTLARLKHPNLLVVHDVGEDGDLVFMVMALASESLADRLYREGPLAPAAACAIGEAVAGALSVAHAAGVVHRDIKPANILADESGRPLLSDFGIARVLDERRTRADAMMGTPLYMAPEQRGAAATADARADIYALGATLYTAMVGYEPAGPIEELAAGALQAIPGPLRSLLRKATARDPERRFSSAEALREALVEVLPRLSGGAAHSAWRPPPLAADPPPATPFLDATVLQDASAVQEPTAVPQSRADGRAPPRAARSRRFRLAVLLVSGSLLAVATFLSSTLLTAGIVGWWASTRLQEAEPADARWVGELRRLTSFPPGVDLEVYGLTADGAAVLYQDYVTGLVWRHPVDGDTPRARLHPELEQPRLVGYFSEDLAAFLDEEGRLSLRDLRSDRVIPFDHRGNQFELSPRGDQIAWQDGRSVFRASVEGGQAVPILTVPEGQLIHGMTWSPDQNALAFVIIGEQKASEKQMRVVIADVDGMMSSRPVYTSGDLSFTDRGAPIVWPWPEALLVPERERAGGRDHLVVVPIEGGRPIHLAPLPVKVGALSARGGTLAVLAWWPLQDTWIGQVGDKGRLLGEPEMPWADEDHDNPVAWLPDGALAFASDRFQDWRLLAQRLDDHEVQVLAEGDGVAVAGSGLVRLRDDGTLERQPLSSELPWVPSEVTRWDRLSCISDGSCVAARHQGDGLEFVHFGPEATRGVVFTRLPITNQVMMALSSDGRTLAVLERSADQALLRLCDLGSRQWRELSLPDISNPQGIAWRTDDEGWWVSTAASKYASGPVMAAIRPDGTIEAQTPLQGLSYFPVPSPDGKWLAFDLNRRDMDVWVAEIPAEAPSAP